jgi:hypothetical protein
MLIVLEVVCWIFAVALGVFVIGNIIVAARRVFRRER